MMGKEGFSKGMSRRSFVTGAALAGFGVASTGLLAGCQQSGEKGGADAARADTTDLVPQTWNMEADVVVCGFGSAGAGGALEAAESGLTCVVLEKQPEETAGGDSMCNAGGLFWSNTDIEGMRIGSFGTWDDARLDAINAEGRTIIDYLEEGGVEWAGDKNGSASYVRGNGPAYYQALVDRLSDTDVEVHYETPVTHIIRHPQTKEAIGVYAEQGGAQIAVKANKGILVSTGGFIGDPSMVEHLGVPGLDYYPLGSPYCTGDGLRIGGEVGAAMGNFWRGIEYDVPVSKAASDASNGNGVFIARHTTLGHPSAIYVNEKGKRFMNEATFMTHWKSDTPAWVSYQYYNATGEVATNEEGYVNIPQYFVCDQACFDGGTLGNSTAGYSYALHHPTEGFVWSQDNKAELEKGWIIQADTIEELAGAINVDPTALAESVHRYNEQCAGGADVDFGRPAENMVAMGDGPYYAIELGISLIYSICGLMIDADSRVLDWFNEPIPRLYAAGNVGQGVFTMPIGLQGCWAEGRLAVRDAATLSAWDATE